MRWSLDCPLGLCADLLRRLRALVGPAISRTPECPGGKPRRRSGADKKQQPAGKEADHRRQGSRTHRRRTSGNRRVPAHVPAGRIDPHSQPWSNSCSNLILNLAPSPTSSAQTIERWLHNAGLRILFRRHRNRAAMPNARQYDCPISCAAPISRDGAKRSHEGIFRRDLAVKEALREYDSSNTVL
jgi:hypothetical protein